MTPDPEPPSDLPGGGSAVPYNRKAIFSIVVAVAGFACVFVFVFGGFALGLPAITSGIHARREIAASQGAERGDDVAVAGLIVGGAAVVLTVVSFLLSGAMG